MSVVVKSVTNNWVKERNASLLPQPCDPYESSSWGQKLETLAQLAAELSFLAIPVDKRKSFSTTVRGNYLKKLQLQQLNNSALLWTC